MGENLISSNDDYFLEFVPSTQVKIEEGVTNEVIIEKEIPTNEVEVTKNQCNEPLQTTPQTKSRVRWSIANMMVLIEAKRIERETQSSGSATRKALSSTEKWKIIQEYYSSHGVPRTTNQCRDHWEHIQPNYKRIRDYEHNIPFGHDSYSNMTSRERIGKILPTKFVAELYDAMEGTFCRDQSINLGNITIDSSNTSFAFHDNNLPNEDDPLDELETQNMGSYEQSKNGSEKDKQCTGKK
ncbi:hypothetical protein SUGI_0710800 [Cryptomeria japonica]|nr:hypothetical protein SUGI_0710800 [Cryptomeria japonica]